MKTYIQVGSHVRKLLTLSCAIAGLGWLYIPTASAQSVESKLTTAAFDANVTNNFPLAISNAAVCIKQFQADALAQQKEIEQSGKVPPIGEPKDEKETKETQAHGPLNAVATCLWIQGDSYMKQYDASDAAKRNLEALQKAHAAYTNTLKYALGRCWDTNGWFWSPAKSAATRLPEIEKLLTSETKSK
jgi:hypothetical protein